MRPLWVFIFALLSVVAAIFLFVAWSGWVMAEFDCADGYLQCRRAWFHDNGVWVAGIIMAWAGAAIWLYRTREKH